jgi:hypothetical protein
MVAIAAAMYSRRPDDLGGATLTYHEHPALVRASENRDGAQEQLFEGACASVISTIQARIAESATPSSKPRKAPKSPVS